MKGRSNLAFDLFSILVGALLGLATSYVTDDNSSVPAGVQQAVSRWALPLAGVLLLSLLAVRAVQYRLDRAAEQDRDWDPRVSPYPGLDSFSEEEAAAFFGREPEIREILARLTAAAADGSRRWIPVVGPSGSGKSSLVQAGVLPRLAGRWVTVPTMVPGSAPVRSLARSLATALPDAAVRALDAELSRDGALAERLEDVRDLSRHRSPMVLLVVDQAEELLTEGTPDAAERFLGILQAAVTRCPWLVVIIVFRPEFLTQFLRGRFAEVFLNPITVGVLSTAALHEVVERPARQAGITFRPPGLVNRMVADTGGGEALPLLAWTLAELWSRRGADGVITEADYDAVGGVSAGIALAADRVVTALADRGIGEDEILSTLLRFFHLRGSTFTRVRLPATALSERETVVVAAFVAARLLTGGGGPNGTYQVTHESMIEHWAPLRQLAETNRAQLEELSRLSRWAEEWEESGRRPAFLLSGGRLEAALRWAAASPRETAASPSVPDFLQSSTRADRVIARRLADASASAAAEWAVREPETAIMAVLAVEHEYARTELTRQVLIAALIATRLRAVVRPGGGAVRQVAWAPAGTHVAAALADGTVSVLDLAGREEVARFRCAAAPALAVAWSPDGARLAAGAEDGSIRVWDVPGGGELAAPPAAAGPVRAVAWSGDGGRLAVADGSGTLRLLTVSTGADEVVPTGHAGGVAGVSWSGSRIATAGLDGTVRLWDTGTPDAAAVVLAGHEDAVLAVRWHPAGVAVASVSADWNLRIWRPDPDGGFGSEVHVAHDAMATHVAWSRDGDRVATTGADQALKLWSTRPVRPVVAERGHDDTATSVDWSPDGDQVVSSSLDGSLRVWTTGVTLLRHDRLTRSVGWDPTGCRLASAAFDGTVRLWDVRSGAELAVLRGHDAEAVHLAWSPDGSWLASTSRDRSVRVWDPDGARCAAVLRGHGGVGTWVAWHPDARLLASASTDRTVRVWRWPAVPGDDVTIPFEHGVTWVKWSPPGDRLAVALVDGTVRVFDAASLAPVRTLGGDTAEMWGAAWSADGGRLSTSSFDGRTRVWDPASGELVTTLDGGADAAEAVAWSPVDRERVAVTFRSGTIRLWDAAAGRLLTVLRGHERSTWGLDWAPDGRRLATSSDDGEIRIWTLPDDLDRAAETARAMGLRPLSTRERARFLLPDHAADG